jgi:hypothetical protein
MINKTISAFSVIITNGTSSIDQGALCGYKVSSGDSGPQVKPDCLLAARNSGQRANLGSPSKNSSLSMKIEGSIPARNGGSVNLDFLLPKVLLLMQRKVGELISVDFVFDLI